MKTDCKALAATLDGFGALWRWGDFYGNPACDGAAEYIAVLDEPSFDGSDDGELTCCRHSVALELYAASCRGSWWRQGSSTSGRGASTSRPREST